MSEKPNLSAGRQALREALRELERTALQGRDRTEAIDQANRRLEQAGLAKLRPTTVGGWFEAGSPAKDFRSLWAMVQVLLELSGQLSPDNLSGPSRGRATARWQSTEELWKKRWEQAKDARPRAAPSANAPLVAAYLKAARDVARRHPYPGVLGAPSLPALADVYVRQQARTPAADDQDSQSPGGTATSGNQAGPVVPAAEVFRADDDVCVLLSGPGGGKSTLLRAHLADVADGWLGSNTGKTIPVMVSAAAVAGMDPLPTVLAKTVTGDLLQAGLLDELGADFFRHPPRAGVPWLVLIDGLDEIPDADTRSAVLTMLAGAATAGAGLYRFVVATRPLPAAELGALGRDVPRYELQPFSHDDLHAYATHWFRILDDPARHAEAFTAELERSHLEDLARTPLMALMLCQLYAADPTRPLPEGRTGAYQSFVELIYEQNAHKNIKNTQDEAIRRLKDRHQIPGDNQAAEQAARQVRNHLPELIDHLAHVWINGSTAPVVDVLASHLQAKRPQKVKQHLWNSFLGDVLRPTGILAQRADDFDFLHQTLLEYHAARHATRDEEARTQLLHGMIAPPSTPADGRLVPPALEASYLGFLLDGLLAPQDRITAETTEYVEKLTAHGVGAGGGAAERACRFLVAQVELRTNLPVAPTAAQLARFADDTALNSYLRVEAAQALARVGGEAGTARLALFADDATFDEYCRVRAAEALARVGGAAGTTRLARFADDTTLNADFRVRAAEALAQVSGKAGAARLALFASDITLDDGFRVDAVRALAQVGDEAGTAQLALLALYGNRRQGAAEALAWVGGKAGAAQPTRLTDDTTLDEYYRMWAATILARVGRAVDGEAGAAQLARLASDTTLHDDDRMSAAMILAGVGKEAGTAQLAHLASNTTPRHDVRVGAAQALLWVDGKAGTVLLAHLADDTTLHDDYRVWAAKVLAGANKQLWVGPAEALFWRSGRDYRVETDTGAALLARLADNPTLNGSSRVWAAEALVRVGGEAGMTRLARLADDTTLDHTDRMEAARVLALRGGESPNKNTEFVRREPPSSSDSDSVEVSDDLSSEEGYP
ncbi:NACHT domain-containing protein [Streptomyces sp. NPDC056653]|uniref:NACHT domain-containing protein n=1 Tax=Streptomyces sp. NPDC056653 TaxID=3345894 RepID=UPI0036AE8CD3